ncbi:MAG: DUF6445 family protein [Alteraurantiacibacter sp.]
MSMTSLVEPELSIRSIGREQLAPMQTIPHCDHSGANIVAGMFYMQGNDSGGTAFYCHRRTGFETISKGREATYRAAVKEEMQNTSIATRDYHYGDTDAYEMLEDIEARQDPLILYRGNLLYSGVIPHGTKLSTDPAAGRPTMNMFFCGQ